MRRCRLIFLVWCWGLILPSTAQQVARGTLEGNYGWILPHSPELRPFSNTHPLGFSGQYQVMKTDSSAWSACNCWHYLGLKLSYHNFGNPQVLGSALGLSGTFEPILWRSGKSSFSLLTGIGLSYLNRIYEENSNPDNLFFSAPISFLLFVTPRFEYALTDNISLTASLSYNHISNGGRSKPNKGINYPMLGLGVAQYFQKTTLPVYSKTQTAKQWSAYADLGFTNRDAAEGEGRKPVWNLSIGGLKGLSPINGLGGGLESTFDQSFSGDNRAGRFIFAPYLAHHFLFGKFDFSQRMGYYLSRPGGFEPMHNFYQRYLLTYRLGTHVGLGLSLKAHGHVAQNIDIRLAWRF